MGQIHEYYFQPNAPDPILSEAEVLRCVRKFVPGARAVTHVDESGGEARAYLVDDEIILKVQRPHQVRVGTSLAKEVFYLNQLAACDSTLPVPRILGYARESNFLEYNIQTQMPGAAFANVELSPEQRREAIFSVGRFLRRIHAIPQTPFRESAHFPTDHTAADFRVRLANYFEFVGKRLHAAGRAWPLALGVPLEKIAERTLAVLPDTIDCAAVHANPGPPHTFVDPHTHRFTGLIDFGDAYISHPVMDLWAWARPADRADVLAGYTSDWPVSDEWLAVWRVVIVVLSLMRLTRFPEQHKEIVADLTQTLDEVSLR